MYRIVSLKGVVLGHCCGYKCIVGALSQIAHFKSSTIFLINKKLIAMLCLQIIACSTQFRRFDNTNFKVIISREWRHTIAITCPSIEQLRQSVLNRVQYVVIENGMFVRIADIQSSGRPKIERNNILLLFLSP